MDDDAQVTYSDRPARVVIVDNHDLARLGLMRLLEGEPDIVVVGEARSGAEAVAMCARLLPDLVLMDVRMPGMDGPSATREIRRIRPDTAVVIVTLYEDQEYIVRAISAGASGYILKDASRQEVLSTMRKVLDGESVIAPALTMRVLRQLNTSSAQRPMPTRGTLTRREIDVLRLVVDGYTNQEIALRLSIGSGTVKSHVEHIISKLGASSRTQAAVQAVQHGLVSLNSSD
jgi:DNA-binding NarL/FixJ family response regulator